MTSRTASIRIRTVTAFLHLPPDNSKWEADVAAAGAFLAAAQQHLQAMGKPCCWRCSVLGARVVSNTAGSQLFSPAAVQAPTML